MLNGLHGMDVAEAGQRQKVALAAQRWWEHEWEQLLLDGSGMAVCGHGIRRAATSACVFVRPRRGAA